MAVTPQQVIEAFQAAQAAGDVAGATEALGNHLAPLFNGGGGSPGVTVLQWTQTSPSTSWGPVTHTLGRRANVNIINSAGQQMFGTVLEPTIGSFVVTFSVPVSGIIQYW